MLNIFPSNDPENLTFELDDKGGLSLGKAFENQHLTHRELEVLKCIFLGYSAKEAALHLGLSPRTIESYIGTIKLKLHCNKKSELIRFCLQIELFRLLS